MIFFCEDCGAKNDLGKADFKAGRAVFRCCSCQYMNSYPVPGTVTKADLLLKKIQSHPEIIGAFLYHGEKGLITNHMPESLIPADLEVLGIYLSKSYLAGLFHYPDIHQVIIAISDKQITIQQIGLDSFFFIVSTTLPLPEVITELLISAEKRDTDNDFF